MLRINNLQLDITENENSLALMAAQTLKVQQSAIEKWEVVKKSVDARKKPNVKLVYSVDVQVKDEKSVLKRCKNKNVTALTSEPYVFPADGKVSGSAVVVGAGPSGLFCALMLQRAGVQVTVLERGRPVEQRSVDVENFWRGGRLDTVSNVQFGEGGAGTFSDGKLTTGVGDHRLGFIIDEFIAHGAPEDIKYLAKPHIGTDKLKEVVKNIRLELIGLGADVRYESRLAAIQSKSGHITGVVVDGKDGKYTLADHRPESHNRMKAFYGNMAVVIRGYCYLRQFDKETLKEIAENAILNANYVRACLKGKFDAFFDRNCMHECVLTPPDPHATGVHTSDIAKRLLDYGFYAPTIYFPLIVPEALMVEPTETENKEMLDAFVSAMEQIYNEIQSNPQVVKDAPHGQPVKRIDEVSAARNPNLRW